jgi:hypothetical protein
MAAVLGPIDTILANKFVHAMAEVDESPRISVTNSPRGTVKDTPKTNIFKMGPELLYEGQGKINDNINLTTNTATPGEEGDVINANTTTTTMGNEGLEPPTLEDTNKDVKGDDRRRLRKQSKQRKRRLKATQQWRSQWTMHMGQVEYEPAHFSGTRVPHWNLMCPTGRAQNHPAADLLLDWATLGCPTRTGRNWTREEIWEAVERGPHRSARSPDAHEHFAEEIKEKNRKKQARLVAWDNIKDNPPAQLKISPIAAIPHNQKHFDRYWICRSASDSRMEGSSRRSMTQPLRARPKGRSTSSGNACLGSCRRLPKQTKMQKNLWQNGI